MQHQAHGAPKVVEKAQEARASLLVQMVVPVSVQITVASASARAVSAASWELLLAPAVQLALLPVSLQAKVVGNPLVMCSPETAVICCLLLSSESTRPLLLCTSGPAV